MFWSGKDEQKNLKKKNNLTGQLVLMFFILIMEVFYWYWKKYILSMFQDTTQGLKNKLSPHDSKLSRITLYCSNKSNCIIKKVTSKHNCEFYFLNCLHSCGTKK